MMSQNLKITLFINPGIVLIGSLLIMRINTNKNDDDLNTRNPFTLSKILHDDNNNNPLNDNQYDNKNGVIHSENYSLIRIIDEYI